MENKDFSKCWYDIVCDHKYCTETNRSQCVRWLEMDYLMEHSGLPKAKQYPKKLFCDEVDYKAFTRLNEIKDTILQFVANGSNLYICGNNTGNGKTSWAIKLLLKYFDSVWDGNGFKQRGVFIHTPTFLMQLKNFDNKQSYIRNLENVIIDLDFVVWDEINGVNPTSYDVTNLLMYLDQRLLAERANVFTSNIVDPAKLTNLIGTRLASRVYNSSEVIEIKGKDRR